VMLLARVQKGGKGEPCLQEIGEVRHGEDTLKGMETGAAGSCRERPGRRRRGKSQYWAHRGGESKERETFGSEEWKDDEEGMNGGEDHE